MSESRHIYFENDLISLREQLLDDTFAVEVYRALCNMKWRNLQHPDQIYSCSWRAAGGLVAEIRNKGEDYLDFYCSGGEGLVSDQVKLAFMGLGWEPLLY